MEAEAVLAALDDWNVKEPIIAMGFDTTSTNTGVHNGACVILQQLLARQLLWLACRHHIPELLLSAAYTTLFGESTSPDIPLFRDLRSCWHQIDPTDIQLQEIPRCYRDEVPELQAYLTAKLDPANAAHIPRCDYKEFLELSLLFIGGTVTRQHGTYQLQDLGADHRARWLSKGNYIVKMSLIRHQLPGLTYHQHEKIKKLALFVVFVYIRYWFDAPSLTSAARNDLTMLRYDQILCLLSNVSTLCIGTHLIFLLPYMV